MILAEAEMGAQDAAGVTVGTDQHSAAEIAFLLLMHRFKWEKSTW